MLLDLWSLWIHLHPDSIISHWGWDKMAAISQTILSIAFSWIKMLEFRLNFHWSLFLRVQLTICQHWFRDWLGAVQVTCHYLNQWWLVYWSIYASLGLNELYHWLMSHGQTAHSRVIRDYTEINMVSADGLVSRVTKQGALWLLSLVAWVMVGVLRGDVVYCIQVILYLGTDDWP